jgi:hypothetical protein
MNQIFTAGYSGHSQRSLILAARSLDALVIDIRHQPFSKYAGFDKKGLQFALDSRYHHLPQLGNVNHAKADAPIQLADPVLGLKRVLQMGSARNLILLCGCRDFENCHRHTVADMLHQCNVASSELEWPDVPKLDFSDLPDEALSIMQPWAWLIVNGYKDIENRTWYPNFKGRFLVHTGKTVDVAAYIDLMQNPKWRKIIPKLGDLDKGGIVGEANLVTHVERSASPWFIGPKGFVLKDAKPLPFKAVPGARGFFSVSEQFEAMKRRAKAA